MPLPTLQQVTARISDCVADVRTDGVNLASMDDEALHAFIRKYGGYFDAMLGIEMNRSEIFQLVRQVEADHVADAAVVTPSFQEVSAFSGA